MKVVADNFSKPSFGGMVEFVRIVKAKNLTLSVAAKRVPGFTSVRNANANLQ